MISLSKLDPEGVVKPRCSCHTAAAAGLAHSGYQRRVDQESDTGKWDSLKDLQGA